MDSLPAFVDARAAGASMRLARLARIVWAANRGYIRWPQIEDRNREAVAAFMRGPIVARAPDVARAGRLGLAARLPGNTGAPGDTNRFRTQAGVWSRRLSAMTHWATFQLGSQDHLRPDLEADVDPRPRKRAWNPRGIEQRIYREVRPYDISLTRSPHYPTNVALERTTIDYLEPGFIFRESPQLLTLARTNYLPAVPPYRGRDYLADPIDYLSEPRDYLSEPDYL